MKQARRGAGGTPGQANTSTARPVLTVLRHMLRPGQCWDCLDEVSEIAGFLTGRHRSKNPCLAAIVCLALNAGMRTGEILGLEWERNAGLPEGQIRTGFTKVLGRAGIKDSRLSTSTGTKC